MECCNHRCEQGDLCPHRQDKTDLFTGTMLWVLGAMFALCAVMTVVAFSFVE